MLNHSLRTFLYGFLLGLLLVIPNSAVSAQTPAPTAFSYQGFLQHGGSPADGSFDFRFTLYDAAGGGNQVGPVESRTLAVQSGVFSTALDFGAVFDRALWLNVEVRPAGDGVLTALTPRTALSSVPYANSISGGTLGNAFFGSGAGRMNSTGVDNAFFGQEAGRTNTTGSFNAFFGRYAGRENTEGHGNTFFGMNAGRDNATGLNNAAFGRSAGEALTSGSWNSFFGTGTGWRITTGERNSFFGQGAGHNTTTGSNNTFVGSGAGSRTTTGIRNTFLGMEAGQNTVDDFNATGNANTFVGYRAGPTAGDLTNATAIGANARVSQSNSLVLGNDVNVGIGTSTPGSLLTVAGVIESTTGGIKFPDGTVQSTAGGGGVVNAILNQSTPQAGANFNISGTGQASVFDAASHFSIFGERILSTRRDLQGLYIGNQTGVNATGQNNTFVGIRAGFSTTTGQNNTFFGRRAGHDNTSGGSNVYFGDSAGEYNTGGHSNVAVGGHSGQFNQGSFNAFVGWGAGSNNVGGSSNSALGYEANVDAPDLEFATAIGAGAMVASSNTVVLGRPGDNVQVPGTLIKSAGSFRIDHPLDPANKYLSHSFVESPDMMNVYNGNVLLDISGEAWIELPAYFEALNREFRYQLTAIGAPGPNLYVADEIAGNQFRIAGGTSGMKVSWQVTGIRKDPYAERNPVIVEQDKPEAQRGRTTTFPRR